MPITMLVLFRFIAGYATDCLSEGFVKMDLESFAFYVQLKNPQIAFGVCVIKKLTLVGIHRSCIAATKT